MTGEAAHGRKEHRSREEMMKGASKEAADEPRIKREKEEQGRIYTSGRPRAK